MNELRVHPNNPRQLSKKSHAQLLKSFKKFNYAELAAINADGTILAGHQRVNIMLELGWGENEIEVRVPNRQLSKKDGEEYLIRSNKNTGDWDYDILANVYDLPDLIDYGFEADDFEIDTDSDIGSEEDDPIESEAEVEPITKLGDLYELDGHRLICGDSTDKDTVEKVLGGIVPILMITDPPYGVNYDASWRSEVRGGKTANGKVMNDDLVDWSLTYKLFPGNIAYVWHGAKHSAEVARNLEVSGYDIIAQIIWNKQHLVLSRGDYHWKHEPCWYGVRKGENHSWKGDRKQTTVWDIANLNCMGKSKDEDERTEHSTQKPLECMSKPMLNHTDENDFVYDPFLGSGTSLIAAEKLNRKCVGIELSPTYCDIILQRFKNLKMKNSQSFVIKLNGEVLEEWNP